MGASKETVGIGYDGTKTQTLFTWESIQYKSIQFDGYDNVPSWERSHIPLPMALLKMMFLFLRWDMLVSWRVIYKSIQFDG